MHCSARHCTTFFSRPGDNRNIMLLKECKNARGSQQCAFNTIMPTRDSSNQCAPLFVDAIKSLGQFLTHLNPTPQIYTITNLQTKTTWNHNGLHTQQFECFCWHVSQWPFELSTYIAFFIRRVLIDSPSTSQGDIWHRQHGARSFFVWPDEVLLQETPGRDLAAMRKSYLYHP